MRRRTKAAPVLTRAKLLRAIPGYNPRDLANGCRFDYEAAKRAILFFHERLTFVRGSLRGQPFVLEPWQQGIVGNLFGWKRRDGRRRFRRCFVYVAKKNGKTALLAGIILYVLMEDGEGGAGIYSAAYNKDQASLIYRDAAAMANADKALAERVTLYGFRGGSQQRSIVLNADPLSTYRPLASDAASADGLDVHLAAIDEVHRHKSGDLIGILEDGTAARNQPIVFYITTADWNRESACNRLLKEARAVRDNGGDPAAPGYDGDLLPVIYEAAAEDDWRDPKTWEKANPNLGVSKPLEYMEAKVKQVEQDPTLLDSFLRLQLNIVTNAEQAAFDVADWDACGEPFDPETVEGERCFGGLDLSKTVDLTSFALWFPDVGYTLVWSWIPQDTAKKAEDRDRVPYFAWARDGHLEMTPGNVVDYQFVRDRLIQICEQYQPVDIAFDPWNGEQMAQELGEHGLKLVKFIQGPKSYNEPCKALCRLVAGRELRHGGNPLLRWCASNLTWRRDANDNIAPDKQRSTGRIDAVTALCMAIGRSIVNEVEPPHEVRIRRL